MLPLDLHDRYGYNSTSNIGIGTAAPTATLDVNGDIQLHTTSSIPMGLNQELGITTTPILNMGVNFRGPKSTTYKGGAFRIDTRAGLCI